MLKPKLLLNKLSCKDRLEQRNYDKRLLESKLREKND